MIRDITTDHITRTINAPLSCTTAPLTLIVWLQKPMRNKITRPGKNARCKLLSTPNNLRPLNQGLITAGTATTFESLVRNVYITTELPLMASTTQDRSRGIIERYLVPTFGSLCL